MAELMKRHENKDSKHRVDDTHRQLKVLDGLYEKERTKNHALIEDLEQCAMTRNRAYYEI